MIKGSLLLPLFLTVLSLFVARSVNRRVLASESSSLDATGKLIGNPKRGLEVEIIRFVAQSLVSLGPAFAFLGAWQALIGWPGFDFFSGPEILLFATPLLAVLSSSISHRIWRQVCFGLIGIGTIFLFSSPSQYSGFVFVADDRGGYLSFLCLELFFFAICCRCER